ncbi:hypothetical protein ACFV2X_21360 [Streptomyces sp. NPDC059679]|uniref:hypothetical protein n=1 Tax=Streptomyces sp. NPDC059679 TaxID=3346903 RepID=UPI003690D3CE
MLHHEFQAARQAAVLARAARRRLVREAEQGARAVGTTADSTAHSTSDADSRKHYFLRSRRA